LQQYSPERVSLVETDVSSEASMVAAYAQITELVGAEGLTGLVNCAGMALLCPAELISVAEFSRVINVNLVGTFAMCRMALPLLRRAGGTIVNISSDAGLLSMPTGSAYCASKFGVEALSDALRAEVRTQGVKVVLIEPGNIDTPIWNSFHAPLQQKLAGLDAEQKALYKEYLDALLAMGGQGIKPEQVADTIVHTLQAKRKKARYLVGPDARVSWLVAKLPAFLRDRLTESIIRSYAVKSEKARQARG
jgi:NAD(P)-dependent dehydrogenase (short-subunit alcohol dehydrogenase family)